MNRVWIIEYQFAMDTKWYPNHGLVFLRRDEGQRALENRRELYGDTSTKYRLTRYSSTRKAALESRGSQAPRVVIHEVRCPACALEAKTREK